MVSANSAIWVPKKSKFQCGEKGGTPKSGKLKNPKFWYFSTENQLSCRKGQFSPKACLHFLKAMRVRVV